MRRYLGCISNISAKNVKSQKDSIRKGRAPRYKPVIPSDSFIPLIFFDAFYAKLIGLTGFIILDPSGVL